MPMSARDVKVLERITTALSDSGKTQTELAHETGLEKTALSKALAGKRRLNLFETAAIADVLGLTLDELVADDQPVFAMRATGIEEGVLNEAQSECARIVEDFLTLRALVGEQR
jgi:transcriptional regulator with XRE-family HTH domain